MIRNFALASGLLATLLLFTACPSSQEGGPTETAPVIPDCLSAASGPFDPMCTLIRFVEMAEGDGILLIDICTDKDTDNVLDISERGEQPIMVVYDILCSFSSAEEAQSFAEANGIFDAKFGPES